ncbi:hypothetical protein cypCar_00000786, partial [Cyprinus carpio]
PVTPRLFKHTVSSALSRNTVWMSKVNLHCWRMSRNDADRGHAMEGGEIMHKVWLMASQVEVPGYSALKEFHRFHRCSGLSQVNALLREQFEEANEANQALMKSLQKAQQEAEQRDTRLRREPEVRGRRKKRQRKGRRDL